MNTETRETSTQLTDLDLFAFQALAWVVDSRLRNTEPGVQEAYEIGRLMLKVRQQFEETRKAETPKLLTEGGSQ